MSEIDYALAYDFATAEDPGVATNFASAPTHSPAVRGNPTPPDNSSPSSSSSVTHATANHRHQPTHVHFNDVESAVDSDNWPFLAPYVVDLDQIRARIRTKGLD